MKRLIHDGGLEEPRPGRRPLGAKNIDRNPASSSMPSDWYEENSCSVETQERNRIVDSATVTRGEMFATRSSDEIIPAASKIVSAASPEPAQSTDGTYQSREGIGSTAPTRPRR